MSKEKWKKFRDFLIGECVGFLICWVMLTYFNPSTEGVINENHEKQQQTIDSLRQVVLQERKARELVERKFEQSDSLAHVFWDSLNQQFNDNEKDKLLHAADQLDDSASFEFFSGWVSESDDN